MATITPYDKIQVGQLRLPTLQEMMITPEYLAQKTEAVQTYATEIQSEAEKAKMFISAEDDNESKEYEGYIGKLTQASKNLAKSGMKGGDIASIKASLGEIKALYNKTILPIITAGQQRVADQNLLKELALKDNSLIFVPKSPTLTDYKNNNYASLLPEMVSGNAITQDVATEMSAFKDQPGQNKYNIIPLKGIKYQYIYEIQRGLNPEQIKNISNPTKLKETLTPIEQTAREILD